VLSFLAARSPRPGNATRRSCRKGLRRARGLIFGWRVASQFWRATCSCRASQGPRAGSVSAGSSEARIAALLGVKGLLAHQTCNLFGGGALPVSRSLWVSAPTWWQGKPASMSLRSFLFISNCKKAVLKTALSMLSRFQKG